MSWLKSHLTITEFGAAVFFGILSLIFAVIIQINLPGVSDASSDFREVPLMMGLFFYRKHLSIALSCIITTFTFYEYGPDVYASVFINHFISLCAIWYGYKYLNKINAPYIIKAISWSFLSVVYFAVFLLPLLSLYEILYLNNTTPFFEHLGALIYVSKVEIIVTLLITTSFLIALESRRKLSESNENLEAVVHQRTLELIEANVTLVNLNEELASSNEEIQLLNENLENLVKERTWTINEQLSQLTKYAHMNAHDLRAPLATLLGIKNLISLEPDKKKKIELVDELSKSAEDLDTIVKKMNRLLEKEVTYTASSSFPQKAKNSLKP